MTTQSEAMQQFLETMKPVILGNMTPQYKTIDQALEDGFRFVEPFVANPERHKEALKMIIEGIGAQCALVQFAPLIKMMSVLQKIGLGKPHPNLGLIQRIEAIGADLMASIRPGEFDVDILPPREKDGAVAGKKLVAFQINAAVYPLPDFTPQSLSLRLTALNENIQFEDVSPTSKMDTVGSYEIGVTEAGKFTETVKETEKLAFKLDGQVAKVESEIGAETARSMERSRQVAVKQSASTHAPLVISSALKNVARWELLRAPNQMLRGGSRFLATAFVPTETGSVTLEVRMRVDLEKYGPHEISTSKQIELSLKPTALLV